MLMAWGTLGVLVLIGILGGGGYAAATAFFHHTLLSDDGTVTLDGTTPADPNMLAKDAGLSLDVYALARMVQSEAGGLREIARQGVAFAAVNYAAAHGTSIGPLLLRATRAGAGYFGRQAQGRYASTSKDPTPAAIDVATAVLGGDVDDPTGGAQQWDSPHAYEDPDKADSVAAARQAAGNQLVILDGVSEDTLRFWRPA